MRRKRQIFILLLEGKNDLECDDMADSNFYKEICLQALSYACLEVVFPRIFY